MEKPNLHKAMFDRVGGDSYLTSTLGFQIYDHWLTPGHPEVAFDARGRLKLNIVVLPGNEVPHPSPSQGDYYIWDSLSDIYFFGLMHASDKQKITQARMRIERLFTGWYVNVEEGNNVSFKPDRIIPLEDSEGFPGNIVSIAGWRATGARAMVALVV